MTVLILSTLDDPHARAVMTALTARNVAVELLDLTEFPSRLALTMAFNDTGRRFAIKRAGGGSLDLETIGAVWWRRPQGFGVPDTFAEPSHRRYVLSESAAAFDGLYQSMNAFWVNRPERDIVAGHKPYQLELARQIGLSIPVTLITNDPEEAREFWRQHDNQVIYKQFRAEIETWRETRRLREEETALAENVRLAPVIFQRFVDAVADVRVTVIGGEIFAASADMREVDYPADFRYNENLKWERHTLPAQIQESLRVLMRRLGLEYGAIDLRLTAEGEYVFLEINPAGQYLWVEKEAGHAITDALATHLARGMRTAASLPDERDPAAEELRRLFKLVAAS